MARYAIYHLIFEVNKLLMKAIYYLLTLYSVITPAFAQTNKPVLHRDPVPFNLGVVDKIESRVLEETRLLNIYLPEGYSPDSASTYPVIYLLDGSNNEDFIHITGIVQFLTMIEAMPKSIIVGITNMDRKRDFTFPTNVAKDKKDFPTTGGSEKFITFLEQELQPFIRKYYKANDSSTLIGQSLGGLLATEVLLKKPYLFDRYFIVSPSLWWDNESLLKNAQSLIKTMPDQARFVYISVANEEKQMVTDAQQLVNLLQTTGSKKLRITYKYLPAEDHLTILHNSIYQAFLSLYPKTVKKE